MPVSPVQPAAPAPAGVASGATEHGDRSTAYAWYVVAVLMIAYVFSFIDRQIMALLIEPIRADLGLTDTQFAIVHGLAFSLFYAVLGIPIAWQTDRRSRPLIIFLGVLFWSIATAACGLARNFWHLLMARFGVGAGEATLSPATYSLLADYFPAEQLGRAAAVYSVGSFVGAGLAFFLGGSVIAAVSHTSGMTLPLLGHLQPWQLTFVIVGLPGVLVGLLIRFTVRDPKRRELSPGAQAQAQPSLWAFLSANRGVFASHYLGYSMSAMVLFSLLSWAPAYLIRTYGLHAQDAGYMLGLIVTIACTTGVLFSGWLMDILQVRGYVDAPMRTGVIGACGVLVPTALLPFAADLGTAAITLSVAFFFAAFPMPPSTAAMQLLTPNRLRARVAALFLFCNSLLGLALGSILIGWLNDRVFGNPRAVGSSLAIVTCGAGILAVCILGTGCRLFRERMAAR
jgi:MFS family permease